MEPEFISAQSNKIFGMADKLCDLFYEFVGHPECLREHVDALDEELVKHGYRPPPKYEPFPHENGENS